MNKTVPMAHRDYSKKLSHLPDIWGTDIEYNASKTLFIKGMTGNISSDYTPFKQFHSTPLEWLEFMFEHCGYNKAVKRGTRTIIEEKCIVVAHYADIAEFNWIFHTIFHNPALRESVTIDPLISGTKILRLTLLHKSGKIVILQDTSAYFMGGLSAFAKTFARKYRKSENGPDFSKEDYNHEKHAEYLENDVLSCVDAYLGLQKLISENFQCPLKASLPATAYAAWTVTIPDGYVYFRQNHIVEDFCKDAYYGGYVHPGYDDLVHAGVIGADRTAAYGYIMMHTLFPVGNGIFTRKFREDKIGFYRCTVKAIHPSFPMVPYRIKNAEGEVTYISYLGVPGDICETTISSEEIIKFRECGYEIIVHDGFYWKKEEPIFQDLMFKCQLLENRGGSFKDVAKLIRNSLYGKFGSNTTIRKYVASIKPQKGMTPFQQENKMCHNIYLWSKEEPLDAPYIMYHWAALITARERLWLFDQMEKVGVENFRGCDTDCVTGDAQQINDLNLTISDTYGDVKLEKEATRYRSRGPKMYAFEGKYKGKAVKIAKYKGCSKKLISDDASFERILTTDDEWEVTGERPAKSLTVLKNPDTPLSVTFTKVVSLLHSDRWYLEEHLFKIYPNPVGPFKDEFYKLKAEHDEMFKERKLSRETSKTTKARRHHEKRAGT